MIDNYSWRLTLVLIKLLLVLLITTSCSNFSLENYPPKNKNEREIISFLLRYQESRNRFNIEQFLSLFYEHGQYSFFDLKVSKAALTKMLPGSWEKLEAKKFPSDIINHEGITGDYFRTWRLYNPKIKIINDIAFVTVMVQFNWWWGLKHHIRLIPDNNGRWVINYTTWETV